ncbi:MAG: DMT family transporter [Pseudomonadota bacterium]
MTSTDFPTDNRRGAAWMLGSIAGATGMTIAVKLLTPELHSAMLAFLRSALGLLLILPILIGAWRKAHRPERPGRPLQFTAWPLHLLRGVLISLALNGGFYALWHLPLATATILFFLAPVFATMLAVPVLGEAVGIRRWSAIAIAFLGALMILRPGFGPGISLASAMAVLSSMAFAMTLMVGKLAARADGPDAVFVSSSVVVVFTTLPLALAFWDLPGSGAQWAGVALLVLGSGLRTYSDIQAYAVGEVGFLAPISYLRLVTVGIAGYLLFQETVDLTTVTGGAVIVGATLYIAWREALRGGSAGGGMP